MQLFITSYKAKKILYQQNYLIFTQSTLEELISRIGLLIQRADKPNYKLLIKTVIICLSLQMLTVKVLQDALHVRKGILANHLNDGLNRFIDK